MRSEPFSLKGKHLLVTGASSGIGRAIARQCAAAGAQLTITGRNTERLQRTADLLPEGTEQLTGDLTDAAFIARLSTDSISYDGIVLNAGVMKLLPLKAMTDAYIDELNAVNYLAPVKLLRSLFKGRKIKKGCAIVVITSINGGVVGSRANALYGATKAAMTGFARALALDLGSKQIRINCIAPGMIDTAGAEAIYAATGADSIAADKKKYPLGRYGAPEDVACATVYLLSPASAWVTGTTLVVDGGFTAQ